MLHPDGWLETDIAMDRAFFEQRIKESTIEYSLKNEKLSETRLYFLDKIVNLLQKYGDVYLIRMPVSKQMADLEQQKFPGFDEKIFAIANKYQVRYFNFIDASGQYITIDTHHLYKEESERFTAQLSDSIASHNKRFAKQLQFISKK
jgi:hypothetical protein